VEYTALLLVVVAAALGYRYVWRRARSRPGPAPCTVDATERGWVELHGTVRSIDPLRSPLTGERVVGYALRIDEERGITAWRPVVEQCRVGDFELEDETGRILIRASVSRVELETGESRGRGGPFRAVPGRIVELLRRHGHPVTGVLFARAFRWRERVIEDGAQVRVRGWVAETELGSRVPSTSAGAFLVGDYRDLPRRLAVIGGGAHPLQVAADD
jgi:hypothetical protein